MVEIGIYPDDVLVQIRLPSGGLLWKVARMNFDYSEKVQGLCRRLSAFLDEFVYPNERAYFDQIKEGDRWQPTAIVEELKPKAQAAGLWNLFLPESEYGAGL